MPILIILQSGSRYIPKVMVLEKLADLEEVFRLQDMAFNAEYKSSEYKSHIKWKVDPAVELHFGKMIMVAEIYPKGWFEKSGVEPEYVNAVLVNFGDVVDLDN